MPEITLQPTSINAGRLRLVTVMGQGFKGKRVNIGPEGKPTWGWAKPVKGGLVVTEEVLTSETGEWTIQATDEDGTVLATAVLTVA